MTQNDFLAGAKFTIKTEGVSAWQFKQVNSKPFLKRFDRLLPLTLIDKEGFTFQDNISCYYPYSDCKLIEGNEDA